MGKTNAEHCKNYYNRKKAAKEAEKARQGLSVKKPIRKTGAERTRAYRLRKKMLSQVEKSNIVQYKRSNVRAGGVAIYQNMHDTSNIITPNIDMTVRQAELTSSTVTSVGEFCVAECKMEDGNKIVSMVNYITSNQKMDDIIHFLKRILWPYTKAGGEYLSRGEDKLPIILSGDFNVNFSREDARPLIDFLQNDLNLVMNNNPLISTTRHGTIIDAVFSRYLNTVNTKIFISYFSYHRPLITKVPIQTLPEDATALDIL